MTPEEIRDLRDEARLLAKSVPHEDDAKSVNQRERWWERRRRADAVHAKLHALAHNIAQETDKLADLEARAATWELIRQELEAVAGDPDRPDDHRRDAREGIQLVEFGWDKQWGGSGYVIPGMSGLLIELVQEHLGVAIGDVALPHLLMGYDRPVYGLAGLPTGEHEHVPGRLEESRHRLERYTEEAERLAGQVEELRSELGAARAA